MNATDLDQLFQHFTNKIQTIYSLIPLSQLYEDLNDKNHWNRNAVIDSNHFNSDDYSKRLSDKRPDLAEISQMVIEMKTITQQIKDRLKQQKQTIVSQSVEYENDLQRIQRHCDHINHNIPTFLQNSKSTKIEDKKTDSVKCSAADQKVNLSKAVAKTNPRPKASANLDFKSKSTQEIKLGAKSGRKKVVPKDIENIGSISFITTEEFDSIPHYMLGRLNYEVINRAIADFNRTIGAKYKLIANYSNRYSDEDLRRYTKYKEQENSETEGQYFCTIGDLKELSDLKSEPTIRKVLTCLRHCKRIREIRGNPPKLVRYAIIMDQMNFN